MKVGAFVPKTKIKSHFAPTLQKLKITLWIAFFLLCGSFFISSNAHAQTFNPHNIISDKFLFTGGDLSRTAIQTFLTRENSVLARYSEIVDGTTKSAAQIIHDASVKWNISARFLLATLEKEQSLITSSQVEEKRLHWAMGYGCFSGQCKDKYKGFANQVDAAAETQNIYRSKTFAFKVGQTTVTYDDYPVTPQNQATTNLYIYTPYVGNAPELGINSRFGGVKLFWKILERYVPEKKYPNGLVLKSGNDYWRIENEQKRRFISREIFLKDYIEQDAIQVRQADLEAYTEGPTIYFANNTLVRSNLTNQVYLLQDGKKRVVVDKTALAKLQFFHLAIENLSQVPTVDNNQLVSYLDGEPIKETTSFPQEKLYRDPSGQLYILQNNLKRPIHNAVASINYPKLIAENISTEGLEGYLTIGPVAIKDGTFVKNPEGKYYLITDGHRRKVDPSVMAQIYGSYKMQNAPVVSDEILELHTAGLPVEIIDDTITDPVVVQQPVISAQSFAAVFEDIEPSNLVLLAGQQLETVVKIENTGTTAWNKENVWLQIDDSEQKLPITQDQVSQFQTAQFSATITGPQKTGITTVRFKLFANDNGSVKEIMSTGKFIPVRGGSSAQLLEEDLPIALINTWKPVDITMKFKNTSDDSWYSRKTALKITDEFGGESPFYDQNDWVRTDVAGVPLNSSTIDPEAEAVFKFTLDPRGVEPGTYTYLVEIERLDQEEDKQQVYIDGVEAKIFKVRIDGG